MAALHVVRKSVREVLERDRHPGAIVVLQDGNVDNFVDLPDEQLRWQRLPAFQKLAFLLLDHLDGLLNYYRVKVRFGVVEALNGNIRTVLKRGRDYKNLRHLLLKVQRMAATKTKFVALRKAA